MKDLKISYATVHLLNGLDALTAANQSANDINVKLLGVSVLTSFDNEELELLGFKNQIEDQVIRLIKIANKAKLYGVICSPLEIKMIKKIISSVLLFFIFFMIFLRKVERKPR